MSVSRTSKFDSLPPEQMIVVNRFCDQFEQLWRDHEEASLTAFLDSVQCVQEDTLAVLQIELVALDRQYRTKYDRETIALDRYASWCPCLTKQDLLSLERGTSTEMQGTLQSGQRIGDYVIHECIGRGGMGQVYRARHELMGREVAIKILLERSNKDAEARSRFEREVRSVAAMSHPNVLAAFDAREFGGMLCLVTEWIDGSNLSEIVAERGPLPVAEALDLIRQAARGLAYAHEKGIIHRDVKPSNLFLDQAGKLKV
ncbi:MAG: serine/threonine protein kinase, partial [Rubripirellula sp.]